MKRLSLIFLLSSFALGQGVVLPTQQALKAVNGVTSPLASATITVCAANASGIPCTPALVGALFKDAALTQPLTNPFTSDANGNYVFAIAPGNYTVTVTGLGFSGYSYQTTAPVSPSGNNTFTQTNTFSGTTNLNGPVNLNGGGTFTGAYAFTGPKPSLTVNSETVGTTNAVRWVGNAPMFSTVELAQTDCQNDVTINACIIWVTSGFRETFTNTIVVGSSTKSTVIWLQNDVILTCNVSAGADCFQIQQASGIVGHNVGEIGSSPRNAGAVIQVASTANIGNVITTSLCNTTGGQGFIKLDNLFISGNNSATVGTHLNLCSVNNQPSISNIFIVAGTNSTGLLLQASSASGAVLGPISLYNVFVDCVYNAGCHPAKITNAAVPNDNSTLGVEISGGYFNHPGSGLPNFEINGNGTTHKALMAVKIKSYFENLQNGSTIGLKLVDVYNVDWTTSIFKMQDTDTCIDISQSGAGRTAAIHTGPFTCQSNSQLVVPVNNHISGIGVAAGPLTIPLYIFGGDGSASFSSSSVDLNNLKVNGAFQGAGSTSGTCNASVDATALTWIFGTCTGGGSSRFYMNPFNNAFAINRNPQSGAVDNSGIWATTFYPTNGHVNFDVYNGGNTFQGTLQLPTITGGITEVMPAVIASGTATMTTAAIGAGACGTTVTVAATNVVTTDTITWAFNAAPAGTNAGIVGWPTSGNVNFAYCPGVAETPAAATINWRVLR